jgi:hypothetical protein
MLSDRFGKDIGITFPLVVSLACLVVMPFALGYIVVDQYFQRTQREDVSWRHWLFLPWLSMLLAMLGLVATAWEGIICLIFAGPIMLLFSMLGGVLKWLFWRMYGRNSPGTLSAIALPLFILFIEVWIPNPSEIRTVHTEIMIHEPATIVWKNIKSVSAIDPSELPASWVNRIGFPRPVAATLSHDGVGGIRKASFTGGLLFTETVDSWQPQSDLRFSIRANTESIPETTLDEHLTIGGALFDVLDGEYQLEPRPDGILLHLISHQRLSTHLNPYAAIWTDSVMRAIQNQILVVIRNRCESQQR